MMIDDFYYDVDDADVDDDVIPADVVGRVFHLTASHFPPKNWICNYQHRIK